MKQRISRVAFYAKACIDFVVYTLVLGVPLPFYLAIVLSVVSLRGGLFHPEGDYILQNMLSREPFWIRLFNGQGPAYFYGGFQAREFSYIGDFIDSAFIVLSAKVGLVHFYSFTHYFGVFLIAFLAFRMAIWYFGQRFYLPALIVSLIFLTHPAAFLGTYFYRTAKILVALVIVVILFTFFRYVSRERENKWAPVWLGTLSVLMALSDKQGFFFAHALTAMVFFMFLLTWNKRVFKTFVVFAVVSSIIMLYTDIIGPFLVGCAVGWDPDYGKPLGYGVYIGVAKAFLQQSILYMDYQTSLFFGQLPLGISRMIMTGAFVLFVPFALFRTRTELATPQTWRLTVSYFFVPLLLIASVPMIGVMLHYSGAFLTWPDLRIVYYALPVIVLILLMTQFLIARLTLFFPFLHKAIVVALFLVLVRNVTLLPMHQATLKNGHLKVHFEATGYLMRCLRDRNKPVAAFRGGLTQHADEACVFLRQRFLGGRIRERAPLQDYSVNGAYSGECKNHEKLIDFLMSLRMPTFLLNK